MREEHRRLFELGFLVADTLNELATVRYDFDRLKNSRSQSLFILPTEQCNFRCVYCYEEFLKQKMSPEMRRGLTQWVEDHAHRWDDFSVAWFGGEPLAAYDVVCELSEAFVATYERHHCTYAASMTTNGYSLGLDRAQRLGELGVRRYQITLDGVGVEHDAKRHLMSGQGTYEKIMRNLFDIHESDLNIAITIRMNIDQINGPHILRLIDVLVDELQGDPRFKFHAHLVGRWGGKNDDALAVYSKEDGIGALIDTTRYGMERGLPSAFHETMLPHTPCYAALPNSLVVGSDGIIYKCTVAFDNPINHVGQLHPDGKMDIRDSQLAQWVSDGSTDATCQSCLVHPICHGSSCPLIRIEEGRRPCPPVREDLPEFIKLLDLESQSLRVR